MRPNACSTLKGAERGTFISQCQIHRGNKLPLLRTLHNIGTYGFTSHPKDEAKQWGSVLPKDTTVSRMGLIYFFIYISITNKTVINGSKPRYIISDF